LRPFWIIEEELLQTVLVTGASGFVGKAVCSALLNCGHSVVAMARKPLRFSSPGFEAWLVEDIAAIPISGFKGLSRVDTIVHCAGRAHKLQDDALDPSIAFRQVNAEVTVTLARRAADAGVKRFIFISSIGVSGSRSGENAFRADDPPAPDTPYAQSKWEAEQGLLALSQETPMTIHVVRPPMIYGPDAPGNFALLAKLVRRGWPLPFGALHAPRSFVARDNVVDLLIHLVQHPRPPSGVYLVADSEIVSTTIFIRAMAEAMGLTPWLVPVPARMLEWMASLVGRGEQIRKMAVPLTVDISSTCSRLDWTPPVTMAVAMQRALAPLPSKSPTTEQIS
jgi:nucleoside-diphosphate-sugar epimerase